MIEEFKDELRDLKNILNKIKKTRVTERTRITWNKRWNKKKIESAGWSSKLYLRKDRCKLNDLKLRFIFCGKPYDFQKERKLRLSAKEKINKIEILK